jgi:hypothetical protein
MNRVQAAVLGKRHTLVAQEVRVDEVASLSLSADISATLSIEFAIEPALNTHVGVVAIAVERSLDSAAVSVHLGLVARDIGNDVEVDVADVGIGAGHDDVEILLELAAVHGHVLGDGTVPEAALNTGGGLGVGTSHAGRLEGVTLEEDGEGIAERGLVAEFGACMNGSAYNAHIIRFDVADISMRQGV